MFYYGIWFCFSVFGDQVLLMKTLFFILLGIELCTKKITYQLRYVTYLRYPIKYFVFFLMSKPGKIPVLISIGSREWFFFGSTVVSFQEEICMPEKLLTFVKKLLVQACTYIWRCKVNVDQLRPYTYRTALANFPLLQISI